MITHRVETFGPWLAAISVALSFVLWGAAGLYTFRQQNHVDSRLCKSAVANRAAVRSTWNAAREFIISRENNQQEREAINEFFAAALHPIPPLVCIDNQPVPKEG